MKPGETIAGRFTVDAFVARGGMGDVYRATDTVSGRQVAVKVIAADHPGMGRRLAAEARALRQLRHPGIVAYVAHEADPERPMYLAMEWLEGITLSERLRTSDLSVTEALTLAARVADALGVAHARGIIHRDIKPLNLFVVDNRPDQVKILDFGIARLSSDERITATGVGMGTPEYMAPEQARCDAVIGPPADIFGLGCVLYKCLTGKTAFRGPRVEAILAKIAMLDEVPRVLAEKPDIPPLVDELTAQLMAFAPGDRPQDGAAAAAAIRACSAALRRGVTFDPDREFAASPSLTRREVQPVSIIFAEPNVAEADTLPAELWQALAPPIGAPTPVHATGPTADTSAATERTFERLRVLRGSSDIDHLMPAIRAALEPHAARVEALLNGSIVTLVTGGVAATDLAARSARAALAIRSILGDASLGIATVRAVTTDRAALDPIIDAAASLVRPRSRQIRIDKHTRNLLSERFAVTADDAGGFVLELERTLTAGAGEPPRRVLGRATPCVGRNRLLRQLGSVVAGCIDDRAAEAVVIVGDAGFGKSRLRAELSRQLRADHDPLWILAAWGDLLRDRVPYGLVGRMLRDALAVPDSPREPGQLDAEQAAALTRAVEALARDDAEARRLAAFLGELCGTDIPTEGKLSLGMNKGWDVAIQPGDTVRFEARSLFSPCIVGDDEQLEGGSIIVRDEAGKLLAFHSESAVGPEGVVYSGISPAELSVRAVDVGCPPYISGGAARAGAFQLVSPDGATVSAPAGAGERAELAIAGETYVLAVAQAHLDDRASYCGQTTFLAKGFPRFRRVSDRNC
jgi:predicted Ser/Thr protein kinase